MTFIKKIENFICERCGASVVGNGYTNHCPKCLWSKHVDVAPGDRLASCGGSMEPIGVEVLSGTALIHHWCTRCGFIRKQTSSPADALDALAEISTKPISSH